MGGPTADTSPHASYRTPGRIAAWPFAAAHVRAHRPCLTAFTILAAGARMSEHALQGAAGECAARRSALERQLFSVPKGGTLRAHSHEILRDD